MTNLKRLSALVVVMLATVFGIQSDASAHPQGAENAFINNVYYDDKCLAVQGMEHDAFVFTCTASFTDQRWHLWQYQDGFEIVYQIQNVLYPNVCLAVRGKEAGNKAV